MRLALRQSNLHMEYLIAGLFDSWRSFFGKAKIDQSELWGIVSRTVKTELPLYTRVAEMDKLPPLSKHAREALLHAARYADARGAKQIYSTHLLYGALSVKECSLVQALNERGVLRENINFADGPDQAVDLEVEVAPPIVQPIPFLAVKSDEGHTDQDSPSEANPTPKVASDLWSEEDRLGYEAYARTIASLITHKETVPPLTIGIKAPWGAGKTSLMKRVQHLLDGDARLSEENRSATMQQGQPSRVTLRELLQELKNSSKPTELEARRSKDGEAYGDRKSTRLNSSHRCI